MRNILVVFSDIYNLIPEEEIEFIKSMQNFRDTLRHSSPERLKDDIELLEYGLDEVMKLKPKQYEYRADGEDGIGFVAQDIQKACTDNN